MWNLDFSGEPLGLEPRVRPNGLFTGPLTFLIEVRLDGKLLTCSLSALNQVGP